jgi:hypothetical protein
MNTKQIILIFIMFFIMVLILSCPLWLEAALPIMKDYLNSAMVTLESWWVFLKFVSGHVAEVFVRIYEKFVLGVD